MEKISVYFMPGLAANASIFERISLPEDQFDTYFMEWEIPLDNETLSEYAQRISKKVTHENPVLIGVSFGGILVQEMAQFLNPSKIIIISSVKSNLEFPNTFKLAKQTKAYKLIPTSLIENVYNLAKFTFGEKVIKRLKLYQMFLTVRDKKYLDWSIEMIILWDRKKADPNVVHIHGDADEVFPIKYIQNCILVKGGTHIMILTKYKWININLPKIIIEK
ncbi:MAG: alpha/beta hydrolase [Flavobacteriaceae bacterium]|nr:alpha/beta hydrolase [Flavobacteriaceae bacterium]